MLDSATLDLARYEQEQADPKYERAAQLIDQMDELKNRIYRLHDADNLAEACERLESLEREYQGLFDRDYYDGPDTVREAM